MPGEDPDDHPHMAATAAAGADTALVTANLGNFPAGPLAALGVRVARPGIYLCELLARYPDETVATVVRMAAEKTGHQDHPASSSPRCKWPDSHLPERVGALL